MALFLWEEGTGQKPAGVQNTPLYMQLVAQAIFFYNGRSLMPQASADH